jgi:hypothetical protein
MSRPRLIRLLPRNAPGGVLVGGRPRASQWGVHTEPPFTNSEGS